MKTLNLLYRYIVFIQLLYLGQFLTLSKAILGYILAMKVATLPHCI